MLRKISKYTLRVLLLLVSIFGSVVGLWNLSRTPGLPGQWAESESGIHFTLSDSSSSVIVTHVNGIPVHRFSDLKERIANYGIGREITLLTGDRRSLAITLIPHFSQWALGIKMLVGILFILLASLLLFSRQREGEKALAAVGLWTGFIVMTNFPGLHLPLPVSAAVVALFWIGIFRALFGFLYASYHFPHPAKSPIKLASLRIAFRYIGFTLALFFIVLYTVKTWHATPAALRGYHSTVRLLFPFIFAVIGFSFINIVVNERRASTPVTQYKLLWAMSGMVLGAIPVVLLRVYPGLLGLPQLLPHEAFVMVLIIPYAALVIALPGYRPGKLHSPLLNIVVDGIGLFIIAGLYVGMLKLAGMMGYRWSEPKFMYMTIAGALLLAMIFAPIKKGVRSWVEGHLFPLGKKRQLALNLFEKELEKCRSVTELGSMLREHFQRMIPVKHFMIYHRQDQYFFPVTDPSEAEPAIEQEIAFVMDALPGTGLHINHNKLTSVEDGYNRPHIPLPSPWVILIPMGNELVWLTGAKQSLQPFYREDIALMEAMATIAYQHWQRLQEIYRTMENKWKPEHGGI